MTSTGGAGSQVVYSDGANQSIVLGADDDTLHGSGGNGWIVGGLVEIDPVPSRASTDARAVAETAMMLNLILLQAVPGGMDRNRKSRAKGPAKVEVRQLSQNLPEGTADTASPGGRKALPR